VFARNHFSIIVRVAEYVGRTIGLLVGLAVNVNASSAKVLLANVVNVKIAKVESVIDFVYVTVMTVIVVITVKYGAEAQSAPSAMKKTAIRVAPTAPITPAPALAAVTKSSAGSAIRFASVAKDPNLRGTAAQVMSEVVTKNPRCRTQF
jgi:hypothetical protein